MHRSTACRLESTTRSMTGTSAACRGATARPAFGARLRGAGLWSPASLLLAATLVLFSFGASARSQRPSPKATDNKPKGDFPAADDDSKPADAKSDEKAGDDKAKSKDKDEDDSKSTSDDRSALPRGMSVPPPRPPEFTLNDPRDNRRRLEELGQGEGARRFQYSHSKRKPRWRLRQDRAGRHPPATRGDDAVRHAGSQG